MRWLGCEVVVVGPGHKHQVTVVDDLMLKVAALGLDACWRAGVRT